MKQRN